MTMDNTFIKLPNISVWDITGKNNTLLNQYGDRILHILSYLDINTNRLGTIRFTLEDMITSCGLVPKRGEGKTNDQFTNIICCLHLENIIDNVKGDYTKPTELITCTLNMPVDDTQWFPLYHEHYIKIMDSDFDKLLLLKIYCYISARLKRKSNNDDGEVVSCMYDSYNTFCKDLDISDRTLNKYLEILRELDILYFDNIGIVTKGQVSHEANNVYCFNKSELPKALANSEYYYMSNGYTIVGKKTTEEIRKINGTKGKITQETNAGKDTDKLNKKLEKLQNGKKPKAVI